MLRLARETNVGGVLYPANTPATDIEGLTSGEHTSLLTSGYLVDDGQDEKRSKSKAKSGNDVSEGGDEEADGSADAETSDAAATPEAETQASPAKPKRTRSRK